MAKVPSAQDIYRSTVPTVRTGVRTAAPRVTVSAEAAISITRSREPCTVLATALGIIW